MARPPDIPPTAAPEGAGAGEPNLWLGPQLWTRRVAHAGVATGGTMGVLRQPRSILPLAGAMLRRHRSAIAHLGADDAGDASLVWLSEQADHPAVTPVTAAAPRIATRAVRADTPAIERGPNPVSAARAPTAASAEAPVSAAPSQLAAPQPAQAPVIQRRAASVNASVPTTAPTSPVSARSAPSTRRSADVGMSAPITVRAAPAGGPRRVGAPIRLSGPTIHRDLPRPAAQETAADAVRTAPAAVQPAPPVRPAAPVARREEMHLSLREPAVATTREASVPARPVAPPVATARSEPRAEGVALPLAPAIARTPVSMLASQSAPTQVYTPRADAMPVLPHAFAPQAASVPATPYTTPIATPLVAREPARVPSPGVVIAAPPPTPKPPLAPLPLVRAEPPESNDATPSSQRQHIAMPVVPRAVPDPDRGGPPQPEPAAMSRAVPPASWRADAPDAPAPAQRPAPRAPAERQKLGAGEIRRVADRVYQLLVNRLTQERQRRGA